MALWATFVSVLKGMLMKNLKGVKLLYARKKTTKLPVPEIDALCLSCLVQLCNGFGSYIILAYGWRARNLLWPIRIQCARKTLQS